jgi:translocation and assembly module TamA
MGQATFTVPGVLDIDTDLVTEFRIAKERPETYESRSARFKIGLNRRFSESLSGNAALAATVARDEDAFGIATYRVVSAPAELVTDTRDSKLDPKRGWRGSLGVEPAHEFYNDQTFVIARSQISGYQAIDNQDRVVLAARFGMASIAGTDTFGIPASMRLYGGGSGSVRGYAHQSIGPMINGQVVGGRGLAEGSLELRWRATKSIGLVGFVDAVAVSAESIPIDADIKIGAGIGVRYYTSLGPIRLDLAVPVENTDKLRFSDVAFYVGLGQAF